MGAAINHALRRRLGQLLPQVAVASRGGGRREEGKECESSSRTRGETTSLPCNSSARPLAWTVLGEGDGGDAVARWANVGRVRRRQNRQRVASSSVRGHCLASKHWASFSRSQVGQIKSSAQLGRVPRRVLACGARAGAEDFDPLAPTLRSLPRVGGWRISCFHKVDDCMCGLTNAGCTQVA